MPYVEVWVDEPSCDGTCDSGKKADRLQAVIDEAERHLRNGDLSAALHALTNDRALGLRDPIEMQADYEKWKNDALPGFANFKGRA